MNKTELVQAIADRSDVSAAVVNNVVNGLIDVTTKALKKGDDVNLTGFGKFEARRRAAKQGVNPKTGEKLKIKARTVVKFTVGQTLKKLIANVKI